MNPRANPVVITGGTRGLGLSHAKRLAADGYSLAIIDLSRDAGLVYGESSSEDVIRNDLMNLGSDRVEFYECDLTNEPDTLNVFERIVLDFGRIGGLIANAGGDVKGTDHQAAGGKPPENSLFIALDHHDQVFDRNYRTCLNCLRAVIPHMKVDSYGKIVTTASVSAGFGVAQETTYSVAKAAVIHLTRSAASELRDHDICVNCIAPGATLTGRFKASISERTEVDQVKIMATNASFLRKPANPAYVSSVVSFLVSEDSDYITGQVVRIDGGQFTSPI